MTKRAWMLVLLGCATGIACGDDSSVADDGGDAEATDDGDVDGGDADADGDGDGDGDGDDDGGADGDADTVDPTTVTGSWIDDYVTDDGATTRAVSLVSTIIQAHLWDGTSFTTRRGAGTAAGTYRIADVPVGPYVLQIGADYFVTSVRDVDLGEDKTGRADVETAASFGTTLTFNLSGLDPWQAGDELELISSGSGAWYHLIQAIATNPPGAGATTTTGMQLMWIGNALINGGAGDAAFLGQLVPQAGPAGSSYLALARVLQADASFAMTDGVDNVIAGALAEAPRSSTIALDWRRSQFAALAAAVHPDAGVLSAELGVAVQPGGLARGPRRPWNHLLHIPPLGVVDDLDLGAVAYADPYPAAWGVFGFASATFAILYQLPGASRTAQSASISVMDDAAVLGAGPIVPVVSPVTGLQINGADARGGATGVGTTPTLSWTAPAAGTPTSYVVGVFEAYVSSGMTSLGNVGGVVTADTSVVVPPGLLTAGRHYVFLVRAMAEPSGDFAAHPFRRSFPVASADAYTNVIDP
jgi:hypothetical protein